MRLATLARLAADLPRPAALIDLDALDANVDALVAGLTPGTTLRIATKSVRHRGVLRRVLARAPARIRGLMCFHAAEAAALAADGFDDLLVAYPTTQPAALAALAGAVAAGATARIVVDCPAHLAALDRAAAAAGVVVEALVDVDVSYRPGLGAHLGVRRSPIRSPEDAAALARAARLHPHVRLVGLMAYEAHVAGLPDGARGARLFKRFARPAVRRLRAEVAAALAAEGVPLTVVDGGGTGSVRWSAGDATLTEVAAGSGLYCPTLFDAYDGLPLRPALFLALEVCRRPDAGHVTCGGGGIVASGPPGADRAPVPVWPPGLSLLGMEGAGEVQTPFACGRDTPPIAVGDTVLLRPAKAGEPLERFAVCHLVRGDAIEATEPTWRGDGMTFM